MLFVFQLFVLLECAENKVVQLTDKTFEAEVCFNGKVLATGVGTSKKSAEMQAAKKALGE